MDSLLSYSRRTLFHADCRTEQKGDSCLRTGVRCSLISFRVPKLIRSQTGSTWKVHYFLVILPITGSPLSESCVTDRSHADPHPLHLLIVIAFRVRCRSQQSSRNKIQMHNLKACRFMAGISFHADFCQCTVCLRDGHADHTLHDEPSSGTQSALILISEAPLSSAN